MKTTITSKGQITVPATIRKQLNLQIGDRLDFEIENGIIRAVPVGKGSLEEFMNTLPQATHAVSVKEMNPGLSGPPTLLTAEQPN